MPSGVDAWFDSNHRVSNLPTDRVGHINTVIIRCRHETDSQRPALDRDQWVWTGARTAGGFGPGRAWQLDRQLATTLGATGPQDCATGAGASIPGAKAVGLGPLSLYLADTVRFTKTSSQNMLCASRHPLGVAGTPQRAILPHGLRGPGGGANLGVWWLSLSRSRAPVDNVRIGLWRSIVQSGEEIWSALRDSLRGNASEAVWAAGLSTLHLVDYHDNELVIGAPNQIQLFRVQQRYCPSSPSRPSDSLVHPCRFRSRSTTQRVRR